MRKKIFVLVFGLGATFLLGTALVLNVFGIYSSPEGFSAEKFRKIVPGMTQDQVLALAGNPTKRVAVGEWNERCSEFWDYSTKPWFCLTYMRFTVYFDREMKVSGATVQQDG